MSKHASPETAFLWMDCDAFRAPAGSPRPDLTGMELEDFSPEGMDAFGGMETGFGISSEGAATPKQVMNHRSSPYKVSRAPKVDTVTFKGVDTSKAYLDTITQGGEILEYPDGTIEIKPGIAEEFALLLVVRDGTEAGAYWSDRVTLSTPPAEGAVDGDTLAGSEFSIIPLSPLRKIYGSRPAALDVADVVQVTADGTPAVGG